MKKKDKYQFNIESFSKFGITVYNSGVVSGCQIDIDKMKRKEKHYFMRWMLDAMDKLTRDSLKRKE